MRMPFDDRESCLYHEMIEQSRELAQPSTIVKIQLVFNDVDSDFIACFFRGVAHIKPERKDFPGIYWQILKF